MGRKLATEWKASFVEASAKQNEVNEIISDMGGGSDWVYLYTHHWEGMGTGQGSH